jgi:hypothetical protein
MQTVIGEEELKCTNHPQTATSLRCSKCLDPICMACSIRTPIGLRCPKCTGAERGRDGTYFVPALLSQVSSQQYLRAIAAAVAIGLVGGVAWGQFRTAGDFGDWSFWFALIIGLLAGEGVARAANERRGLKLQIAAATAVLVAALVALAWGILVKEGLEISQIRSYLDESFMRQYLGLTVPNALFTLFGMFLAAQRLKL